MAVIDAFADREALDDLDAHGEQCCFVVAWYSFLGFGAVSLGNNAESSADARTQKNRQVTEQKRR